MRLEHLIGILGAVIMLILVMFGESLEKLINDKKPIVQLSVKVLEVDDSRSGRTYSGRRGGYNFTPNYGIRYELPDGKQKFKSAPSPEYKWVKVGDEGILTLQGWRFISFEKRESLDL